MTSSDHNMRHMEFLELVAASDVAVLRKKEATYQGSWKAAGGRSAWFMARRNIDRLLNMMSPPPWPESFSIEDIDDAAQASDGESSLTPELAGWLAQMLRSEDLFLKMEEHPRGDDGTVLAVCRDLRRYLMLVEAEMISRGVVSAEQGEVRPGAGSVRFENLTDNTVFLDPRELHATTPPNTPLGSQPTMAENMSEALRTRPQPKLYTGDGQLIYLDHHYHYQHEVSGPVLRVRTTLLLGDMVRIDVGEGVILQVPPERLLSLREGGLPNKPWQSAAAPLALQPWLVDQSWIHAHGSAKHNAQAVDTYYKRQALNLWVLEPAVLNLLPPPQVAHLYGEEGWHILGIHHCPPEARDYFPRLESEVNTVTRDQLPEWQRPMYYWSESETKWRISPTFEAWTVRD